LKNNRRKVDGKFTMCSLPLVITATLGAAFHLEKRNKALSMTLEAERRENLCAE
jgi:hypothetical protein